MGVVVASMVILLMVPCECNGASPPSYHPSKRIDNENSRRPLLNHNSTTNATSTNTNTNTNNISSSTAAGAGGGASGGASGGFSGGGGPGGGYSELPERIRTDSEDAFMRWSQNVLGISSLLEIQYFPYIDHLKDRNHFQNRLYDDDHYNYFQNQNYQHSFHSVRGLAATRNIQVGEVVLSIPFNAMITVPTTIDHDPVLSKHLGPDVRSKYGWDQPPVAKYYELPLLILAILYHKYIIGIHDSPLSHYLLILDSAPVDSIPFLWNHSHYCAQITNTTNTCQITTDTIRTMARAIRTDVRNMYEDIMGLLIQHNPQFFANPASLTNHTSHSTWPFSFHNFQWAFALVNSRHWHLPCTDLDTFYHNYANHGTTHHHHHHHHHQQQQQHHYHHHTNNKQNNLNNRPRNKNHHHHYHNENDQTQTLPPHVTISSFSDVNNPPAAQPTEKWVQQQEEVEIEESTTPSDDDDDDNDDNNDPDIDNNNAPSSSSSSTTNSDKTPIAPPMTSSQQQQQHHHQQQQFKERYHSFIAPMADLLNYGPPCTHGAYNSKIHAFEVVATCPFRAGQEVTFYYTDDCDDVLIANYGFTHPMAPPCSANTADTTNKDDDNDNDRMDDDRDLRLEPWTERILELEQLLDLAYTEMDDLDIKVQQLKRKLSKCILSIENGSGGKDCIQDDDDDNTINDAVLFEVDTHQTEDGVEPIAEYYHDDDAADDDDTLLRHHEQWRGTKMSSSVFDGGVRGGSGSTMDTQKKHSNNHPRVEEEELERTTITTTTPTTLAMARKRSNKRQKDVDEDIL